MFVTVDPVTEGGYQQETGFSTGLVHMGVFTSF
jgi:hypothetical protein